MKPNSLATFTPRVRAQCSCGVEVEIGYSNGAPTVMHPWPSCETFMRFDSPIDYVKHLNREAIAQAKEHVRRASARYRIPQG